MPNRLATLLLAISPDCRESVKLLSAPGAAHLPFLRRWGLRMHLMLCAFCRRYQRQIDRLRSPSQTGQLEVSGTLTADARQRIKESLHQLRNPGSCPCQHE